MSAPPCPRKWQVEATRDGRLSGKDLEHAARHRETCLECAEEARQLSGLSRDFARLGELTRDPLAVRRARQHLLTSVNQLLLGAPRRPSLRWLPALALLPAAALSYALLQRRVPPRPASDPPKSVVEVHAEAGARWQLYRDADGDHVDFSEGRASFNVHPHPGRRVLVRLPDGEIEDLGTVFQVAVRDQHTEQIAVTQGRVLIRLAGEPEFRLGAGEHWEREPTATATASAAPVASHLAAGVLPRVPRPAPAVPAAAPALAASASPVPSSAPEADTTRAEDAAYLNVVSLLRQQRYAEARARAKAYLLRFPNGFRRVEVLNVATSGDGDAAAP